MISKRSMLLAPFDHLHQSKPIGRDLIRETHKTHELADRHQDHDHDHDRRERNRIKRPAYPQLGRMHIGHEPPKVISNGSDPRSDPRIDFNCCMHHDGNERVL